MTTGPDVQAAFAAVLVDEWVRAGVTDAVVAPGSRSTPVLVALAADGRVRLHVVLDERSGAFVALGLGAATGRPAPFVTTSGTAAAEAHAAVVEAHQAGVPMLVITTDRPPELQRVGAPQTIVQTGLYGESVRAAFDPGLPDTAAQGSWRSLASRSVADTVTHPSGPGPVHLNLPWREPLLGSAADIPPGRPRSAPWHSVEPASAAVPRGSTVELIAEHAGRPGLVVAGAGASATADDAAALLRGAAELGWPVLADPRSGCRVEHPQVVASADALLRIPEMQACRPEIVLRLGRPWASKVLNQWLGGLGTEVAQIAVNPHGQWIDPERTASVVERCDPAALVAAVLDRLGRSGPLAGSGAGDQEGGGGRSAAAGEFGRRWTGAEKAAQRAIDRWLADQAGLSEPGIAREVTAAAPDGSSLVVSSSMPVRDVEWWGVRRSGLRVLANRGANGIDGVLSTAIGVALGTAGPTVALLGDLAFLYDISSLFGAAGRDLDLTVIVVDNDGGGIFSFLPQATELPSDRFERLWATPHGLDLVAVAAGWGVTASVVEDLDGLRAALGTRARGIRVVVARTDRQDNVAVHDRLNAAVGLAVRG